MNGVLEIVRLVEMIAKYALTRAGEWRGRNRPRLGVAPARPQRLLDQPTFGPPPGVSTSAATS